MAGLQAHAILQQAGYDVTIIDKGYKLGGRLSTRRKQGFAFDHGTPALSASQMAKLSTLPAIKAAYQAGVLQPAPPHRQSDNVSLAGHGYGERARNAQSVPVLGGRVCAVAIL